MNATWSLTNTFQTSYNQLYGATAQQRTDPSRLNDPTRFKTCSDTLTRQNRENNSNDFKTVSKLSYTDPQTKHRPFALLNTNQSGFARNNLNNDGLTYYNGRKVDKKDMRLTEYRNKFRPFK